MAAAQEGDLGLWCELDLSSGTLTMVVDNAGATAIHFWDTKPSIAPRSREVGIQLGHPVGGHVATHPEAEQERLGSTE